MIRLLAQYKISCALRGGRPLSAFWRAIVDRSPELRAFEARLRELDRRLADAARTGSPIPPRDLHASIVHALRQVDSRQEGRARVEPRRVGPPRWSALLPAVAVLLMLAAVWWGRQPDRVPTTGSPAEHETAAALEGGIPLLPVPADFIAEWERWQSDMEPDPLGQQWEALTDDARAAARFLLASLP